MCKTLYILSNLFFVINIKISIFYALCVFFLWSKSWSILQRERSLMHEPTQITRTRCCEWPFLLCVVFIVLHREWAAIFHYIFSIHTLTLRVSADSSALTTGGWFMAERCECILIRFNAPLRCDTYILVYINCLLTYKWTAFMRSRSVCAWCDDQLGQSLFDLWGKHFLKCTIEFYAARRTITSWVTSEIK